VTALSFALVDVFAAAPLSGNPLTVISDADLIPEAVMPRIAQEFNQSETTFVLSSTEPRVTRRLRSFTARGDEVTGAGHNALGAWWWLAQSGRVATGDFTQELGGSLGDLTIRRTGDTTLQVAMHQGSGSVAGEVASSARTFDPTAGAPAHIKRMWIAPGLDTATGSRPVDAFNDEPCADCWLEKALV
jgi:trans-2,3-dihydro-3-hydroxyanthranilate isomerase